MNPIVFALRRPFTVLVAVTAAVLGGALAWTRMTFDVFPNLNLPVIYVCQPYGGMDPGQMEGLLTNYYEYHFLYINGIHHVESRNVQGMALMKLFFHPGTNMAQAMGETIAYVTRSRAFMPPGTVSPFVTRFDVGSVPVGYLTLSSETKTVGEIQDQALFKVRPMFAALPGVSAPPPFGGSQRTVVVRLKPDRLNAYAMPPDEIIRALEQNNAISPSGNIRIGDEMPIVPINSLAKDISELNDIVIRPGKLPTVRLGDVATIQDSSDIATGYALVQGRRAVYILVTKRADASTLDVVRNVKAAIPQMQAALPDDIKVGFEFDQSPVITRAMRSLILEGALGAALTGLMVLLFLRDVRSALIVTINIPIALIAALAALWLSGQSVNLMTLGGLALAVGILVDEATVAVENIHSRFGRDPTAAVAIKRGALETAVPRLLAMLCIIAVFLPSFLMQGSAQALFVPLALAVGFAMMASYLLSSTLVPVLCAWLLKPKTYADGHDPNPNRNPGLDPSRSRYLMFARAMARLRWLIVPAYLAVAAAVALGLGGRLAWEIFPSIDSGRFQVRLKAPAGTRIEKSEQLAVQTLGAIREEAGLGAVDFSIGYVGTIPSSYPINAIHQWSGGPEEVLLRVALKPSARIRVAELKTRLRDRLARTMPDVQASFEPADIVSDVMSFGAPTPIEVAVSGPNLQVIREFATKVRDQMAKLDSLRDLRFSQALDYPTLRVKIDREKAGSSGLTVAEISRSVVAATSSSRFVVPLYWPDPKTGIGYQVQVEIPFALMNSTEALESLPIKNENGRPLLLRDVATLQRDATPGEYDRYNMKRYLTLTANLAGRDLGQAIQDVEQAIKNAGDPPKDVKVELRGQAVPFREIIAGLSFGLALAAVAILLLLVANFQSVRLAIASLFTVPAALAGVVAFLWLTGTTVNIQSFLGAIMTIGVATANAILLTTFAERLRTEANLSAVEAAARGAASRSRAILMTSCAMIAGMLPMALGWGEGAEQAAPLGRAVVGGLLASTVAALVVLPAAFALLQSGADRRSASLDPHDPASRHYLGDRNGDDDGDGPESAGPNGRGGSGLTISDDMDPARLVHRTFT